MPKPSSDNDDAMDGEMFDFLSEDAANRPARKQVDVDSELPLPPRKSKPLPTIRKPVPVSQSGPNVRPGSSAPLSANTPVAKHDDRRTPSQQSGSQSIDDDFDFLDETLEKPHQAVPVSQSRPMSVDSFDQFDENWNEGVHDYYDDNDDEPRRRKWPFFAVMGIGVIALASYAALQSDLLDSKSIENLVGAADEASAVAIPAPGNSVGESIADQFRRELARIKALVANGELALATTEIDALDARVLGYGNPEFTAIRAQIAASDTSTSSTESADAERLSEAQRLAEEAVIAEEKRLAAEARRLAEVESARVAEETRLAEAQVAEEARIAEAQAAEEARRAEQARLAEAQAAEDARRAEQARLAEAQAAEDARRAEQARLAEAQAAEDARRAEQARLAEAQAAEDARRAEQARLAEAQAAEDARRAEQARLAEEARRAEAARVAEQQRLQEQSAAREDQLQAEAERLERERLEAIAAEQRAEARRAAAARAAQASSQVASATPSVDIDRDATNRLTANASAGQGSSASSNNQNDQSSVQAYSITDADFNSAYKRFIAVKTAIEGRDINLITQLADTDGARVQALLQLFSNSESVKASIDNVSTRNSAGMIVGNLTITRVVRRGGGTMSPPANLRSFTLTTRRDAAGWSKIKW